MRCFECRKREFKKRQTKYVKHRVKIFKQMEDLNGVEAVTRQPIPLLQLLLFDITSHFDYPPLRRLCGHNCSFSSPNTSIFTSIKEHILDTILSAAWHPPSGTAPHAQPEPTKRFHLVFQPVLINKNQSSFDAAAKPPCLGTPFFKSGTVVDPNNPM